MQRNHIDICIGHFESHGRIELRYPESTMRLWEQLSNKTREYLWLPEVRERLDKNAALANEWIIAQVVLDRLASEKRTPYLVVSEAQDMQTLISSALLYWESVGRHWQWSRIILITMADIARYLFNPLAPAAERGKVVSRNPGVVCYEQIRAEIGNAPTWFSLNSIHGFWFELEKYKGENERILVLEKPLNILCKGYRLLLQRLEAG